MSPRRRKGEADQAANNAEAWLAIARDTERRQVDGVLASIARGSFSFQPMLVTAVLRQFLLESDTFGEWLASEAARAQRDLRRRAA